MLLSTTHTSTARGGGGSSVHKRLRCARSTAKPGSSSSTVLLDLSHKTAAAVLWDLDNVRPARAKLVSAVQELTGLLGSLGLSQQQQQQQQQQQPTSVVCYANPTTCEALGGLIHNNKQQLLQAGVQVQQVQPKQQAADVRLSSDAFHFAQTHRQGGCLVVVTKDTGFAPVLAYCSSLEVTTILVTTLPSPKYMPELLPDLRSHSLAAACTATLPWRQQQQQQQLQGSRTPLSRCSQSWHSLEQHVEQLQFIEPWLWVR